MWSSNNSRRPFWISFAAASGAILDAEAGKGGNAKKGAEMLSDFLKVLGYAGGEKAMTLPAGPLGPAGALGLGPRGQRLENASHGKIGHGCRHLIRACDYRDQHPTRPNHELGGAAPVFTVTDRRDYAEGGRCPHFMVASGVKIAISASTPLLAAAIFWRAVSMSMSTCSTVLSRRAAKRWWISPPHFCFSLFVHTAA